MARKTAPARFIKHDSIKTGDVIKVERQIQDAIVTHVGRVAKREHSNYGTDYITAEGIVLYTHTRDDLAKAKITLLERSLNVEELTLF